ncbi:MAG: tetratricopeptide repeat protein [Polaromonas sp.]|nr:tetratricopeptide repeat protein [Polaromonas sp.]
MSAFTPLCGTPCAPGRPIFSAGTNCAATDFLLIGPFFKALRVLLGALAVLLSAPTWADSYDDVARLIGSGQYALAQSAAEQYLTGKPRDPQMRFLLGVVQTDTGKIDQAITSFSELTQDYPELPEPYNNLAVLYAGRNQLELARAALDMAIRNNPRYAVAHENLGDVYARLASQAYTQALQLDAGNAAIAPKLALLRSLVASAPKAAPAPAAGAAPGQR